MAKVDGNRPASKLEPQDLVHLPEAERPLWQDVCASKEDCPRFARRLEPCTRLLFEQIAPTPFAARDLIICSQRGLTAELDVNRIHGSISCGLSHLIHGTLRHTIVGFIDKNGFSFGSTKIAGSYWFSDRVPRSVVEAAFADLDAEQQRLWALLLNQAESFGQLEERYIDTASWLAGRYARTPNDIDAARGVAWETLRRAIMGFDPKLGFQFFTYAKPLITKRLLSFRRIKKKQYLPPSNAEIDLDIVATDQRIGPADEAIRNEVLKLAFDDINAFDEETRRVLQDRFFLGMTYMEIAARNAITVNQVRYRIDTAKILLGQKLDRYRDA